MLREIVIKKRLELGLSQRALSLNCGFHHVKINLYEKGKYDLKEFEKRKVLTELGIEGYIDKIEDEEEIVELKKGHVFINECAKCKRKTLSTYEFKDKVRSLICDRRFIGFMGKDGTMEGSKNKMIKCDFWGAK